MSNFSRLLSEGVSVGLYEGLKDGRCVMGDLPIARSGERSPRHESPMTFMS